jgi:hypothetical protein
MSRRTMASNPQLRHNPERLRVSASRVTHGPVQSPLPASLDSIASFPRLLRAPQLAKLSREKATQHAVFLTEGTGSPQSPQASVGEPSCTTEAGVA